MAKLVMSSPWVVYYREVQELFRLDPRVHVLYFEDTNELKIFVDNDRKADAIYRLMPNEKTFGNVTLKISVIPCSGDKLKSCANIDNSNLFDVAFYGNEAYSFSKVISGIFVNDIIYVVFRNTVVQYFDDDLGDIYGQCSTLYQCLAKDVFNSIDNVYYCTDKEYKNQNPNNTYEWIT